MRLPPAQRAVLVVPFIAALAALGACGPPAGVELRQSAITLRFPETGFSPCRFNFGMGWQKEGKRAEYVPGLNYTTMWIGTTEEPNKYWEGEFLRQHRAGGKLAGRTPVFYSYIIAFTARRDRMLKDCDVGTPNLCVEGADYIRKNEARILAQYEKWAKLTAAIWGQEDPIIWLMEPDFYQYAESRQKGGPLTFAQAGALMAKLVGKVREFLPNAVFSMDVSPWTGDPAAWWKAMGLERFAFVNTSGGRTDADSTKVRNENNLGWAQLSSLTKRRIIADDGYGVGGAATGHDATWDSRTNLQNRMKDGVIAITQANPRPDWGDTVAALRAALPPVEGCTDALEGGPAVPAVDGAAILATKKDGGADALEDDEDEDQDGGERRDARAGSEAGVRDARAEAATEPRPADGAVAAADAGPRAPTGGEPDTARPRAGGSKPPAGPAQEEEDDEPRTAGKRAGGCAMAGGEAPPGALGFFAAALALLVRRPRRRGQ